MISTNYPGRESIVKRAKHRANLIAIMVRQVKIWLDQVRLIDERAQAGKARPPRPQLRANLEEAWSYMSAY